MEDLSGSRNEDPPVEDFSFVGPNVGVSLGSHCVQNIHLLEELLPVCLTLLRSY